MANSDAELKISADASEVATAMKQAVASVRQGTDQMSAHLSSLTGSFAKLQSVFATSIAVLAGGAAFKSAIDATTKWNGEVVGLSKTLGINTDKAAALNYALQHLGIESETYTGAADKMYRQLQKNGPAFETLGVKTKDANGQWRSAGDIMPEVIEKLKGIHNTTQQNIAGQQIFGKGWAEARVLMKLTGDELARSAQKVKDLNLVTDPAQIRSYKESMNDLKLINTSLQVQIGNALIPVLTNLGTVMGEEGPAMGQAFKGVLQGIGFVAMATWMSLKDMGDAIGALAAQAAALAHGDLQMAKAIGRTRDEQAAKNEADFERMKKLMFTDAPKPKATGGSQDDAHGLDFGKGATDQIAVWKAALEARKEVEGQFFKDSLDSDIAYWSEKLNHVRRGSKEERAIKHELFTLHKQDAQASLAADIATIEYQITIAKNDTALKVSLAKQEAELVKGTYGEKSKEYIAQLRKVEDAERAHRDTLNALELGRLDHIKAMGLSALELKRENLRFEREMGNVSAVQELQALRALKEQEYQIELQAANDRLAFIKGDPVAKQKALDEIAQMEQKHAIEISKNAHDTALAVKSAWEKMLDPISSAFDSSIKGMILGTTTMQKAMANMGNAIAGEFVNLGVKMVRSWISTELAKTSATQAGTAVRAGVEKTASMQSLAMSAGTALKEIANSAWVAAANVYKSIAAIPVVGPFLAPAAAVAAGAAVIGFGKSVMSAEGGYDIPAGVNPMTQLHQKEMVLPAQYADVIRGLDGGGSSGANASPVHIHGSPESTIKLKDLAKLLTQLNRNFVLVR